MKLGREKSNKSKCYLSDEIKILGKVTGRRFHDVDIKKISKTKAEAQKTQKRSSKHLLFRPCYNFLDPSNLSGANDTFDQMGIITVYVLVTKQSEKMSGSITIREIAPSCNHSIKPEDASFALWSLFII